MAEDKNGSAVIHVKPEKSPVPIGSRGLVLQSFEELQRFAEAVSKSGIAPKGMNTMPAVMMAIQAGMERGLGPLGGIQNCVVVNGNLSWRGQAAVALIQNSGLCVKGTLKFWTQGEGENMAGIAVAHRIGYREPERREFSVPDAKKAGLWGKAGSWQQYPRRMLMWRAVGLLARDVFPDVLGGFPIAEEAVDFEPTAPSRPPITARPEGPAPSGPDPLLAALDVTPGEDGIFAAKAEATKEEAPEEDKEFYPGTVGTHYAGKELCEHGTPEGDFCQQCSVEMDKEAAEEEGQMELPK